MNKQSIPIPKKIFGLAFATIAVLAFSACQFNSDSSNCRSAAKTQRLMALGDSLKRQQPGSVDSIRHAMATADDSLEYYDYALLYASHFLMTVTPDSSLFYVDKAEHFLKAFPVSPRINGMRARMLAARGSHLYLLHGNPDSVVRLYRSAYQLLSVSDQTSYLPDLAANMADAYAEKHDLTKASHWFRKALVLADSLGRNDTQTLSYRMGLGRVYTALGDFPSALRSYKIVDQRFDDLTPAMQIVFLNNYGNTYYYQKQYRQSLKAFRRLQRHLEQKGTPDVLDMKICKLNMADVFLRLHQSDSSRVYLEQVEPFFHQRNIEAGVFYCNTIRIGLALHAGHYADIEHTLRQERLSAPINPMLKDIRYEYLSEYYARTGDYSRAYRLQKSVYETHDSIMNRQNIARANDIMVRLSEDTLRLHNQLRVQEERANYQVNLHIMGGIVAFLIVVVSVLLAKLFYNRKRTLQRHIDMLNLRLTIVRQRISPHFIFNVLNSCVGSYGPNEANRLTLLARLIRSSLDISSKTFVTLDQEIDFVKQFVEMEESLMGQDFIVSYDFPPTDKMNAILIPSMFVQILTENAIIHGLKHKEGEKHLMISVAIDDQQACICVKDNGPGFDIRAYNNAKARIGLNIIRHTMAIINEENKSSKIRFDIHNDHGCSAILTVPRHLKAL
ncbi:tetratricopeptide repeat protein [Prevotella sp. P4-119]|uniref:tetratricopeptide repeat-containing sensor histidine kinase n=1 Tax=Prevotella sp. P4-119 TaxID=2024218 RepID=UPI000B96AFAB|nr:tetratricopeptide repeat protein [Prevotella sp. P4-119]OYP46363.1 hypothetical protein CIK89_01100 [Prevotella sp. P4-119]